MTNALAKSSALRLNFVMLMQGVDTLRSQVFNACPKTFKGEWITGPLLVQLLTAAVEAANKPGGVLNIGSMWSAMLQAELKEATAAAEHVYKTATDALATAKTPEEAERCHKVGVQHITDKQFMSSGGQTSAHETSMPYYAGSTMTGELWLSPKCSRLQIDCSCDSKIAALLNMAGLATRQW